MKKTLLSLFALAAMSATALAADVKPALVYGTGGKVDKSFNEAAYAGAEKFKTETGIDYRDFEPTSDTQGEQAIRNFASRGFNPVVAVSFAWTSAMEKVAAEFPDTKFVLVDSVVDLPNVRSVVYKEEEGSYLVGVLAGMASKGQGLEGRDAKQALHHYEQAALMGMKEAVRPAHQALLEYLGSEEDLDRLAAQNKAEDALKLLDAKVAPAFAASREELKGDLLVQLGRADDAHAAYEKAKAALSEDAAVGGLQMKLDDLAKGDA